MSDFRQRAERAHDEKEQRRAGDQAKQEQVAAEHLTTLLGTVLGIDLAQPLDRNAYGHEGIRFHAKHKNGDWLLYGALTLSENGMRLTQVVPIRSLADVGALYRNGKA